MEHKEIIFRGVRSSNSRGNVMESKVIKVEGMSCEHCQATVEKGVRELQGVSEVSADIQKGETAVSFDPALVQEEAIKEKIRSLGYQA
jgi:copper chaperone